MALKRPTALLMLLLGSTLAWAAQASPTDCSSGARHTAAQAEIDAALKTVGDGPLRNRARLESQLKASGATRGWSQEQQAEMLFKAACCGARNCWPWMGCLRSTLPCAEPGASAAM